METSPKDKFLKKELSKLEEMAGSALIEIENSSPEMKEALKGFKFYSVTEYESQEQAKKGKPIYLVKVPFKCHEQLQKLQRKLIIEMDRKLKGNTLFTVKRNILSKWVKQNKSQIIPRSRTLSTVYDAILDDLCLPSTIIGKRTRVKTDGKKFMKISLDVNDKDILEEKIDAISQIYKKLTTR